MDFIPALQHSPAIQLFQSWVSNSADVPLNPEEQHPL